MLLKNIEHCHDTLFYHLTQVGTSWVIIPLHIIIKININRYFKLKIVKKMLPEVGIEPCHNI